MPLMTFHMQGIFFSSSLTTLTYFFDNQNLNRKELTIKLTDCHISDFILHIYVKYISKQKDWDHCFIDKCF